MFVILPHYFFFFAGRILQKTSIILTFLVYWVCSAERLRCRGGHCSPTQNKEGTVMEAPLFDGKLVHSQRIIYTPSPFARSNLVHLQEVGRLQARNPMPAPARGWPPPVLHGGERQRHLEYDGTTRALRAGDCAFLDCRKPYRHYTDEDLWQLRWVHFYGPTWGYLQKYEERGGQPSFRRECSRPMPRCWKLCTHWPIPTIMCATCRYDENCSC